MLRDGLLWLVEEGLRNRMNEKEKGMERSREAKLVVRRRMVGEVFGVRRRGRGALVLVRGEE